MCELGWEASEESGKGSHRGREDAESRGSSHISADAGRDAPVVVLGADNA